MTTPNPWIAAMRPRTLPLALSSILMGSFLAMAIDAFRWPVFALACLTTIFLQILSNLANDYGDSIHGADSQHRQGPQRAVQSGAISSASMKRAMMLLGALSLASGISLLLTALGTSNLSWLLGFLTLGFVALWAAVAYTATDKPYGYAGLGDVSVFVFFGLVGVLGTLCLHTANFFEWASLLPAASCGLLATGVLNVNNIRDISSDALAGKHSIPVRIGREKAVVYHWLLLCGALLCSVAYTLLQYHSYWQWLFLLTAPLIIRNGNAVATITQAQRLDPFLKQLAISTLLFVITFGIGLLIKP